MTFHDRKTFILISDRVRNNAIERIRYAAPDTVVTISPKTRSSEQNAKLHALLSDLARSDVTWAGKRRTLEEWKALIISGHAVATKHGGEVIPGIEDEFVAIRESSAQMSVSRAASLIEYLTAFCVSHGVELRDVERGGFNHEPGSEESSPASASQPAGSASDIHSPGSADDGTDPAPEPVTAGAEGQEESSPAPVAEDFTDEEWTWLKQATRQLWAATDRGEQDLVKGAWVGITTDKPASIGQPVYAKATSIKDVCKQVCFGEMDIADARRLVATHIGASEDELRMWEPQA